MSNPVTPLRGSPAKENKTPGNVSRAPNSTRKALFKSPQVQFADGTEDAPRLPKHERSTPSSGRGKLKRIKDELVTKLASLKPQTASPSHVLSRSMLSFDLQSGTRFGNDNDLIAGESGLFVKFLSDRRNSTGRGTLQSLINRRIGYQTGVQALAQRQAAKAKQAAPPPSAATKPTTLPDPPKPHIPRVKLKGKKVVSRPVAVPVSNRESDQYTLEIPLGQDQTARCSVAVSEAAMSQTQVFQRGTEPRMSGSVCMSPTQVLERNVPETRCASPIRVDCTELLAPVNESSSTPAGDTPDSSPPTRAKSVTSASTPLETESVSSPADTEIASMPNLTQTSSATGTTPLPFMPTPTVKQGATRKNTRMRFMDIEAELSGDEASGDEDDEDDESESDLSDLIASSPEEDTFNHASLHSKWLRENDEKIHLPVRKKEAIPSVRRPQYRYQDLVSTKIAHPRGMNVKAVSSKAVKATSSKPLPTKPSPVEPVAAPIQRKAEAKPRVRKYPHRKSSVSSSTDVEVRIGARLLGSKGATGGFLFIAKPPVEKLQRIVEIDEAKLVAESKAASGQRLCGARRFVFGAGVDQ